MDCDVDLDATFAEWKTALMNAIAEADTAHPKAIRVEAGAAESASSPVTSAAADASEPSRENPFLAPIVDKRPLTREASSKQTMHLAFSTAGSRADLPGWRCLWRDPAERSHELVSEIIDANSTSARRLGPGPRSGSVSLVTPSLNHLQITRLTRKMI